jgi:hypothetical protein
MNLWLDYLLLALLLLGSPLALPVYFWLVFGALVELGQQVEAGRRWLSGLVSTRG